ncbi:hypothetical protein SCLARK_001656 [Spiroplasma clarkii]|uniref:Transmembrane protein n=1 Tax=Spiroplasma clarkii TaxID=2139 RepID=A0A1Y0L269_9MOLU|nr:hypothetical protein [Spiroplasma clarkii]ARU92124.1 hypothetical protein SCLARK_001656 [Spiroplasma clarkii]ATX71462.1 hypothetical protein SCLAR_v1c11620 [Spiroplasma clarkii]
MGFKIWKIAIGFILTVAIVVMLPFVYISWIDSLQVVFLKEIALVPIIVWAIIGFQVLNFIFVLLSLNKNEQVKKITTIFNVSFSVLLLFLVPLVIFKTGLTQLPIIISIVTLLGGDLGVTVSAAVIKAKVINNQVYNTANAVVNSPVSDIAMGSATSDPTELRTRIQNMQSGLSKSFEEAIDEIEKTGTLSGIKIGKITDDDIDNNKIVPVSLAEIEKKPEALGQVETNGGLVNNLDYESIHETSLSRKSDDKDFLSKREFDDWDSH